MALHSAFVAAKWQYGGVLDSMPPPGEGALAWIIHGSAEGDLKEQSLLVMVELNHRLTIARRLAHVGFSHIPTLCAYHDAVGDVRRWAAQLRWRARLAGTR